MTFVLVAITGCFDPAPPDCLRCESTCPVGQSCVDGRCKAMPQLECPPRPDQTAQCDSKCCIGPECLERAPDQAGSIALWLDWTSLDVLESRPVWHDRSVDRRRARTFGSELRVMKRGEARLLANSSSDDYISVANLNDAFDGQADFLLLFAGAQSCDEFVGGDAQCVLHRSGGGTGLHLCIADPGASAEFRTCELFEESTPSCKAIIAPPSVCGRFELLGLRRVTPTPGGASQLELRREGRPVMTIDAAAVDLGARRPLRIGGSEKRSYSGEIALVALIIGNVDDHETCLIEDFVLRSLKAAGLRDESDTTLDQCG